MASIIIALSPAQVQRIALALQMLDDNKKIAELQENLRLHYERIGSPEQYNLEELTTMFKEAADAYIDPRSTDAISWNSPMKIHGFCL